MPNKASSEWNGKQGLVTRSAGVPNGEKIRKGMTSVQMGQRVEIVRSIDGVCGDLGAKIV